MLQVVFNEISAAELSRLPTQTQFVLIEAMNVQPEDVEPGRLEKRFGVIARGGKAPLVLAAVVLVLGLALAFASPALRTADTHEVRTGNVSNTEAMSKARHPAWVIFLGPVIGAVGVMIGGKLKRRA